MFCRKRVPGVLADAVNELGTLAREVIEQLFQELILLVSTIAKRMGVAKRTLCRYLERNKTAEMIQTDRDGR